MSLKTRLSLLIVALVAGVVIVLSVLYLHSIATARFGDLLERTTTAALQVQSFLLQRIGEQSASVQPQPANLDETKALWHRIVRQDQELPGLLEGTMASTHTILEIEVAGEGGTILASSNPTSVGRRLQNLPSLAEWSRKTPWKQLGEVLTHGRNYEVSIPLVVEGQERPVFRIQVILSSVLLRNELMPQVRQLVKLVLLSLGIAILLAIAVSNLAFRPLSRIGDAIDRIARGEFSREPEGKESKEYAAVQSKLNVLGQQFRGYVASRARTSLT